MPLNILSIYKKTWPGNKFGVSFLHDSAHCEHCVKGKINIVPLIRNKPNIPNYDPPGVEDLSKSCFYKSHSKSFPEIKHNSIPKSFFSPLGVKITKSVAAKLNKTCDVKKTIKDPLQNQCVRRNLFKSNNCENKKVRKYSKTENKEPVHKELYSNYYPPVKVPLVKQAKEVKKRKIPVKKPTSPSKLVKEPTKGTLKRKKWTLQKLKQSNQNYEDDLFEKQKFHNFENIIEDEDDSNKYQEMRTPRINLSPVRDGSSTPTYNDCYSPGELLHNRKEAVEYLHKRTKRRKLKLRNEIEKSSEPSPKKPLPPPPQRTICVLQQVCEILQNKIKPKEAKESDEDEYFTDISDTSE